MGRKVCLQQSYADIEAVMQAAGLACVQLCVILGPFDSSAGRYATILRADVYFPSKGSHSRSLGCGKGVMLSAIRHDHVLVVA